MTRRISAQRYLLYATLILLAFIYMVPVYMVLITAFKDPANINLQTVWNLPSPLNLEGFGEAVTAFAPNLFNSVALVIPATLLSAILGSMNGYILAKWKFPGANIIFPLMLFGMFIPYQSILIPMFQFLGSLDRSLGGLNEFLRSIGVGPLKFAGSILGLVLVHVVYGLPITTLIFRNYYAEVPTELVEAASIDGAGFFGIYSRVMFPISMPGFVVVIIWQFTQIWNEFLFAVTLTSGTSNEPITVALANLAGGEAVNWNMPMAGALLAALPTLLVYILLGRYFIRGLLAGSVKG